jgi:hypothetical protein
MAVKFTDEEISGLIAETKILTDDYDQLSRFRERRGYRERDIEIEGTQGSKFRLILRQTILNPMDFSVILAVRSVDSNKLFRLRRYNGKHIHTNRIEKNRFYGFHIHEATERYQRLGMKEESFAEPTENYSDIHGAISCMINDCNFKLPDDHQGRLFEQV